MKSRVTPGLLALALCGCWPSQTRPLTEPESSLVDRMCSMIAEHALRSDDPTDRAVSRAIEEARRSSRIAAFEDNQSGWHGAVVLDRLYLHRSILDGSESLESPCCPYPLEMLYHEGVHLTQSCLARLFSPGDAEARAHTEQMRFVKAWEKGRTRHRGGPGPR